MSGVETRTRQAALFGRLADELTRASLRRGQFSAVLRGTRRSSVVKEDGHFVFTDLRASPPAYELELTSPQYQTRVLTVNALAAGANEVAVDGEDEVQVIITDIDMNRVSFANIPFLPPLADGAPVEGEGGFSTTLDEAIEGVDVDGAELVSVTGLTIGEALRIARSRRLLMRPGPYYAFSPGTTVVAVRTVENMAGATPVANARVQITAVNSAAVTSVVVGTVTLFRAELPTATPATLPFMVGDEKARETFTNERGDAVFYFPEVTPVQTLTLSISRAGYTTQTRVVTVQPGERVLELVALPRS